MKNSFWRNNLYLYMVLAVYFLAGGWLLSFVAYFTDSPDTIFYLTISRKYASGNFYGAINNYWSPLISWLLVPFQAVISDPLVSFKVLQLILGALGLVISNRLATIFIRRTILKQIFTACLVPVMLSYALIYETPDLLFLILLLWLIYHLLMLYHQWFATHATSEKMTASSAIKHGILTGLLGALLYFTKSFGFPYFMAAFSFFLVACLRTSHQPSQKKLSLKFFFAGLTAFMVLSSCWMGALYMKYGTLSTGYASVYNFNLLAKEIYTPGVSKLTHPVLESGLMNVSENEEASAWESPGSSKLPSWSPFDSFASFKHYLKIIEYNWLSFYYFIISRNIGMAFLLTIILYFITMFRSINRLPYAFFMSAACLLILTAGYSLVFFMPRYLWLCYLLMPLMMFQLLEAILDEKKTLRWPAYCIIALALVLLVKKPVKEILYRKDVSKNVAGLWHDVTHPVETLNHSYRKNMHFPELIIKIKSAGINDGNVAGISTNEPANYSYTQSLLICMYLHQSFFGELKPQQPLQEKVAQLGQFNIRYLYSWEMAEVEIPHAVKMMEDPVTGFTLTRLE